jgi:hypothetical protein
MPNQIWSKISTLLAVAFLTFGVVSLCLGKVGMSLWGFGFAAVLLTYSVLRWTEWGNEFWGRFTSPSSWFLPNESATHHIPTFAVPTVRPTRSWTAWATSLGATMWLAILFTALAVIGVATGNFLSGAVFLAFVGIGLMFHYEKQETMWSWTKSTGWPFLRTHWRWLWLAISVVGSLWTVMSGGYLTTLYSWGLSTVLAFLTLVGFWGWIAKLFGEALNNEHGRVAQLFALFVASLLVVVLVWFGANGMQVEQSNIFNALFIPVSIAFLCFIGLVLMTIKKLTS